MLTTRPTIPSPTLIEAIVLVRLTVSPSLSPFDGPNNTTPTLSSSRFKTIPSKPESKRTNSPYCALDKPYTRAIPSPTSSTVPTSSKEEEVSIPANWSFKIAETSAGLIAAIVFYLCAIIRLCQFSFKLFQLMCNTCVVLQIADSKDKTSHNRWINIVF